MISFCFSSINWAKNFRDFSFWYVLLKNAHIMTIMLQICGYIVPIRYQVQVNPTIPQRNRSSSLFKDLKYRTHYMLMEI